MGNAHPTWYRPVKSTDASAMFHALDVSGNGYLTLKDLMDSPAPGLMMLHSLPALFFFDGAKNGRLTEDEFACLVHFCQAERRSYEDLLVHDKKFRDLILRASKAGVKDCSMTGRSSYRRLSSYNNVRSVFSSRRCAAQRDATSVCADDVVCGASLPPRQPSLDEHHQYSYPSSTTSVAMYSSQRELQTDPLSPPPDGISADSFLTPSAVSDIASDDASSSDPDLRNPQNRTALDVAVLEKIVNSSMHKLADLLHIEGSREKFMAWLWELADFNSSGVVTLEELRVFLAALREDGIDLSELAFYREGGEPLEVCIINEFDTNHAGLLSRDEFMVLADLVTREYEFWESRHLERIGDYELCRTIGRGSSGVVRLATHVESRQKFAIKIIKKGKCSDLSRLDREIQSLMSARHKHIVGLEEVLDSENNIFIVMELCGGGSMVDIVRLYPEERMPEETARFFIRQVFEALAFCHTNGICHRDLRLDNLMLDNSAIVKIIDFGHSGTYTPGWDLFSTSLVGSVYNLAPEQIHGQVYSGEKIDIWSAGVAVYCLLVGQPPFYEPEVNLLLERITEGLFDVPDFVSDNACDFIQCMIRPAPEERIPIQQMLHHPWFYGGPEYGPAMNVVVFPLDMFYKKRPDIAEMILAIAIYQHNLHFHLADTHNPHSSPDELRGQEWTLRCLCPRNDIKFTVSLFTTKPHPARRRNGQLPTVASALHLSPSVGTACEQPKPAPLNAPNASCANLLELGQGHNNWRDGIIHPKDDVDSLSGVSAARPPLQRNAYRVTPMDVAARIRAASVSKMGDPFDFEPDGEEESMDGSCSSNVTMVERETNDSNSAGSNGQKWRFGRGKGTHARSHSLDEPGNIRRMNRSATVDAFPYQKVYPQRKMPESARNLDFSKPELGGGSSSALGLGSGTEKVDECGRRGVSLDGMEGRCESAPITPTYGKAVELGEAWIASRLTEDGLRSPNGYGVREREIAQKLYRHPSKAVSPQSPQIGRLPSGADEMVEMRVGTSAMSVIDDSCCRTKSDLDCDEVALPSPAVCGEQDAFSGIDAEKEAVSDAEEGNKVSQKKRETEVGGAAFRTEGRGSVDSMVEAKEEAIDEGQMSPFIEVRLLDGESGLFLKICRKLKTMCVTKLAAAAERQKKKACGKQSLTAIHHRPPVVDNVTATAAVVPNGVSTAAVAGSEL